MGKFLYPDSKPVQVDDVTLAHVRYVIFERLKRRESTILSIADKGKLRSFCIGPGIPLEIELDSIEVPLDRALVNEYAKAANSSRGILVTI